ncbi:MAG: hypothetical protein M9954_16585 [Cyclobacteriaceae bacterium]|nr:hypothetical protein [Flammeovirgaceae bacterium]MCO5273280.1 hypothetical protein [Cyclobacteriaceae bacterium]MCW5903225.1 hypothetical protein [Cyclobacteriaceae bacterium]
MDFVAEMRKTYWCAVPHTWYTSWVWLVSGLIGDMVSKPMAIVFFLVGCTLIFPIGEWIRKVLGGTGKASEGNTLPQLFVQLAFTIPMGYPLVYLACRANIHYFFPAFTVLVGAHYLPFVYGYGKKTFGLLAVLLVGTGTLCIFYLNQSFSISAYITAGWLALFGTLHYYQLKKETA